MPFDSKFDGVWSFIIKPTVESFGHIAVRGDDIFNVGSILTDIFKNIEFADYIIADLTQANPNVYYELGYSHALNKKVILLTQQMSNLPFDLRGQRVIEYSDSVQGAEKLKKDLNNFIKTI